jgi:glucose-1-phosphate thymidylyltransferase
MIYYPIRMLVDAGIKDIMIVTGGNGAGDFLRLIGNGREFGLSHVHYTYQEQAGGIAEALSLTEDFVDDDKVVVVLGDNILEKGIENAVRAFAKQDRGARIFLKQVEHPWEYGVAVTDGDRVVKIIEKPKDPPSDTAVIGVYMYPPNVFKIVRTLERSGRGELEITDVNNAYIERGEMEYDLVDGWWLDCGEDHEALLKASITVARQRGIDI